MFEIIVVSSDSDSDSDLEGLVDMVVSKTKAQFSRKTQPGSKMNRQQNVSSSTTTTRRTRSSTRRLSESTSVDIAETDTNTEKVSEHSDDIAFFIDKKPGMNNLAAKSSTNASFSKSNMSLSNSNPKEAVEPSCSSGDTKNYMDDDNKVAKSRHSNVLGQSDDEDSSDEETNSSSRPTEKKDKLTKSKFKRMELSSSLQTGVDLSDIYVNVRSFQQPQEHKPQIDALLLGGKDKQIMKKSVITPDFEKKDRVLPYTESMRKLKMQRRKERATTKGSGWYNMPATELTEERKNDLKVLQMRHILDPKRFYRANDIHSAPKYFQFGTVVESKADFYSSRIPKKQRKATLVDELFADAEFRRFNKRKYAEIQEAKRLGMGPYQKMRFPKKKKKSKK